VQTITHQFGGPPVQGMPLVPGAVIRQGDRYDSTSASWEACEWVVGLPVPAGNHVVWVRSTDLSEEALILLGFLTRFPGGLYSHVWESSPGRYDVVPFANWTPFDATFQWATHDVHDARCVQELIDFGYLALGPKQGRRPNYSVTPSGWERSRQG
jgi:hypothetical protein